MDNSSTVTTVAPTSGGPDDWQDDLSVIDSNRYMLDNQVDCDVKFTLLPLGGASAADHDSIQIGCHRYMLISRSPVFFAMFTGPLADCTVPALAAGKSSVVPTADIRINDITPNTFWTLLRYLYYEELELSEETVFSVLYAAKKYLVTSLARHCIKYLDKVLSAENVCVFLENIFLFEDEYPRLRQRCLEVVERQSKRVFHSESFFEISKETLCRVLRAERLSVHEVDVFRACLHWAERRVSLLNLAPTATNRRQVLGEALKLIHFPAMNIDEFTKIVVPTGVLNVDEENGIFRVLLGADGTQTGSGPSGNCSSGQGLAVSLPFPRNSRNFVSTRCDISYSGYTRHGAGLSQYRVGALGTTPHRTGWSLTFYCDHSFKVQEIGFFGTMKGNVYVAQNGYRKLDVTSSSPVGMFQFGDDVDLDAGQFTIGADAPFTSIGDYFMRPNTATPGTVAMPTVLSSTDHDRANLVIREATALGFLAYIVFVPTDEIYFIDNYYSDDSSQLCLSSLIE